MKRNASDVLHDGQESNELDELALNFPAQHIVKFLLNELIANSAREKIDQLLMLSAIFILRVDGYKEFIAINKITTYDQYVAIMQKESDLFMHVFAEARSFSKGHVGDRNHPEPSEDIQARAQPF